MLLRLWARFGVKYVLAALIAASYVVLLCHVVRIVSHHTQNLVIYVNRAPFGAAAPGSNFKRVIRLEPLNQPERRVDKDVRVFTPAARIYKLDAAKTTKRPTHLSSKRRQEPGNNGTEKGSNENDFGDTVTSRGAGATGDVKSTETTRPSHASEPVPLFTARNGARKARSDTEENKIERNDTNASMTDMVAANGVKRNTSRTNGTVVVPKIPERYPVVDPANKNRILLLAYFRSGSSFLGRLLSSASNETFFSYEPLDLLSAGERLNASTVRTGLDILNNHLTCRFSRMADYLAMAFKRWNHYAANTFLMNLCNRRVEVCLNPKFMTAVCRRSRVHVVKVTRLSVAHLLTWLRRNAAMRNVLKVVYLVRDPRAMVVSRRIMSWCRTSPKCKSPEHLCREMREDLDAFEQLKGLLPNGTALRLRYEDIAARPQNESKALFRLLGLEFSGAVADFLSEHTTWADLKALRNPYSIVRRSDVAALAWTRKLSWERVREIQDTCAVVLQRLDYKIFHDREELLSLLP